MTPSELIHRATMGTLTSAEIEKIANSLRSNEGDTYNNLLVLGRAGAKQFRGDVEKYLHFPSDPMISRLALQILCRYWGLGKELAAEILQFVKGVVWDEEDDVRILAIGCADALIGDPDHRELLAEIYKIATDEGEDEIARQAAYASIAISSGVAPSDLPSPARFNVHNDMDPAILAKAKDLISA